MKPSALIELKEVIDKCIADGLPDQIQKTAEIIKTCLDSGGKVMTAGNGGSACDAAHLAEELLGKYLKPRRPYPAIHLGGDSATITCIANDFGFEEVFARQVECLTQPGDVFVAFSTSGNSQNIIKALWRCRHNGGIAILVSGRTGGLASDAADHTLYVPSSSTARIQEIHTSILHQWLEFIER